MFLTCISFEKNLNELSSLYYEILFDYLLELYAKIKVISY